MKTNFGDVLWRWTGTIDRGPYAIVGVVLFALKHNLDRFLAIAVYDRPWSLFAYFSPEDVLHINQLSQKDLAFYRAILATAIPFIYVGITLTLARLRAARLPGWLVAVFFLPFVNLVFFAVLCVLPTTSDGDSDRPPSGKLKSILDRIVPESALGSAAMAMVLTIPLFVGGVFLSVYALGQYGWSLFVGMPFCLGLYSVLIYGYHKPRNIGSCIAVSLLATTLLGLALVAFAFEGFICVLMAAPIMAILAMVGAVIGYAVQKREFTVHQAPATLLVLMLSIPALMGAEYRSNPQPPLIAVQTSVEIDAPPEKVWQNVVSFTELPPPEDLFFKTGIAYPMRAEIQGRGVGAVRHCVFSTGPFVEPIEIWDEPNLLKFSVTAQPDAMDEMTLFKGVRPPHLDHYLASEGGQFRLTALPNGRTRLEGTTWYRNKMWPSDYWQVWSDMVIHRIHERVLDHVKNLSEQN